MASFPRHALTVVLISATALFSASSHARGTDCDVTIVTVRANDWPEPRRPSFDDSKLAGAIADFKAATLERRFALAVRPGFLPAPAALCAVDHALAARGCIEGAGPVVVAPGRAACERQSVPSRSRRKLRTWERDAQV